MKHLFILLSFVLLTVACDAAGASPWLPTRKNVVYEYETSNGRGKVTGYYTVAVKNIANSGNGQSVTLACAKFDRRHQAISGQNQVLEYFVGDDSVFQLKESFDMPVKDDKYKINIYGDDIEFPGHVETGEMLPEYSITIFLDYEDENEEWNNEGNASVTRSVRREVMGCETVQTALGTFDCIVLEEEILSRDFRNSEQKILKKTWYAEGIGEVKTEKYSQKGNLLETSILSLILDLGESD